MDVDRAATDERVCISDYPEFDYFNEKAVTRAAYEEWRSDVDES